MVISKKEIGKKVAKKRYDLVFKGILKKGLLGCLLLITMLATNSSHAYFSINSVREYPGPEYASSIAKIYINRSDNKHGICTGFFIDNLNKKPFLVTARHCVEYEMTSACKNNSFTVITEIGKFKGTCEKIIAGSIFDDIIIILIDFADNKQKALKDISFLSLSSVKPQIYTRFNALGYPVDIYNKDKLLRLVKNCWQVDKVVTKGDISLNVLNALNHASAETIEQTKKLRKKQLYHNCSIFGGMSGGPLIIEGTREVVGIPDGYFSSGGIPYFFSYDVGTTYELFSNFIQRNIKSLKKNDVTIITESSINIEEHVDRTRKWFSTF